MPPEDVHSMARGPLATGGSAYYADLVADGFESAGAPIEPGMARLDFGCSSGRAVRVLSAGCEGTAFRLGVDHDFYRPLPVERRRDTVLFGPLRRAELAGLV